MTAFSFPPHNKFSPAAFELGLLSPPSLPRSVQVFSNNAFRWWDFRPIHFTVVTDVPFGGVYIVARAEPWVPSGLLSPINGVAVGTTFVRFGYVGEAGAIGARHQYHEHKDRFSRFGADVALLLQVESEPRRKEIEADIIARYNPSLNA